jgi:hypothetical protein
VPIVFRDTKGSALTHQEMDANWRYINQDNIREDLADDTDADNGPAMVKASQLRTYAYDTLGGHFNYYPTVKDKPWQALGDDENDDAAELNAAFASGKKWIRLPFGTYRIGYDVTLPSGVSIVADPGTVIKSTGGNFIVTGSSTVWYIKFNLNSTANQVYGEGADDITFIDCEFTGSTNNGLLMSVGPQRLKVIRCKGYSNTKAGFYVAGTSADAPNDILFDSVEAYSNGDGGGISIAGTGQKTVGPVTANYARVVRLVNCHTYDNGVTANSGLDLPYIDGLTVTNCFSHDNFEHGAALQETKNFTFNGGAFYDNDQAGICMQSGFDPYNPCQIGTINGSLCTGNAAVGVWFKEQNENIVLNGVIAINNTLHNIRFSDLGGSGRRSEDIIGIGCITEPSPGGGVTNSNNSLRIAINGNLNNQGQPPQTNQMVRPPALISTSLTIDSKGTDESYPELLTFTNSGTDIARTAIAEATNGRKITMRADGSGGVVIRHNNGNGTTLAGFLNNSGASITLGAWQSRTYIANGIDWAEEGV